MFTSSKEGDQLFKPVRNPRRPRDAPPDDVTGDSKERETQQSKEDGGDEAKEATSDATKPGRRRRAGEDEGDDISVKLSAGKVSDSNSWMTSPEKRTQSNKLLIEQEEIADENTTRKGIGNNKFFTGGEQDDIIMIPDLDEDGADGDHRVSHAPRNMARKIPSLADLESEVKQAVSSVEVEGYDLAVLLRTLVPPTLVQEADDAWTFESLLREVTDEITLTPKTVVGATITNSSKKEDKGKKMPK